MLYFLKLSSTMFSTDYRLGDQSGCLEDPQSLLDCCYFLPPVCDWRRRSSPIILPQGGCNLFQSTIHCNGQVAEEGKKSQQVEERTSHVTSASGLVLRQSTTNPRMHLLSYPESSFCVFLATGLAFNPETIFSNSVCRRCVFSSL